MLSSVDVKPIIKNEFIKLKMNPSADVVKKYNRDLDIVMQKNYKCNCFTKNDMATTSKPITAEEVAKLLGLDPNVDGPEINSYVRKARDRLIQHHDTLYEEKVEMLATIRSTLNDEVLNVLENSKGYDDACMKKDPYELYKFIIDIIYYKINTNAHIQTTNEIILEVYNIKQGPTEELLNYQHRVTAAMEMSERTQERHTKFLTEVNRPAENVIPADTIVMYSVLRGLNDNYLAFKMDVSNRMQHTKGDFPYTDVVQMLNHAAEFHSITSGKGKSMINFASRTSEKTETKLCTYCNGTHYSDKCWKKFPLLRPQTMTHKKNTTSATSQVPA
jgi:hypothetical protein